MNCSAHVHNLDDYLDGSLPLPERRDLEQHLSECTPCRTELARARAMREAMRTQPIEPPTPGFAAQALRRAAGGKETHGPRALLGAALGGALAATLALWLFGTAPHRASSPSVTLTVAQEHTVNLVFKTSQALAGTTFNLELPAGLELAGHPGERALTWHDNLHAGANLLALPLVAHQPVSGELVARIRHGTETRTFRVRVDVRRAGISHSDNPHPLST